MPESYSPAAFAELLAAVPPRDGWDLSRVYAVRGRVPWDCEDVVARYLRPADEILDIGTGGGEVLARLAPRFGTGLGVDPDPQLIQRARATSPARNLVFDVGDERLETVPGLFDVILSRHAPLDLEAVAARLRPGGYFVTQQVGERNMARVRLALDRVLAGNVDQRGFVTNEHRYLAVARSARPC